MGYIHAGFNLATCYEKGWGVTIDVKKAL